MEAGVGAGDQPTAQTGSQVVPAAKPPTTSAPAQGASAPIPRPPALDEDPGFDDADLVDQDAFDADEEAMREMELDLEMDALPPPLMLHKTSLAPAPKVVPAALSNAPPSASAAQPVPAHALDDEEDFDDMDAFDDDALQELERIEGSQPAALTNVGKSSSQAQAIAEVDQPAAGAGPQAVGVTESSDVDMGVPTEAGTEMAPQKVDSMLTAELVDDEAALWD